MPGRSPAAALGSGVVRNLSRQAAEKMKVDASMRRPPTAPATSVSRPPRPGPAISAAEALAWSLALPSIRSSGASRCGK